MAKQTFTAGQVLTATQMNNLQANDYNWTTSAQTASYVLVAANAGQTVTMTNASATTITVNTGLFAAGDRVSILNLGAGACTITAGTATVNSAGSLVLPQYASGTLWFSSASAAIFIPDDRNAGLTLITAQTIGSAVSSVAVNNVFSSTYDNYFVTVSGGVGSTTSNLGLQMGSTLTGYYWTGIYRQYTTSTVTADQAANATNFAYFGRGTTNSLNGQAFIYGPNLAKNTHVITNNAGASTADYFAQFGGYLNDTTQYTGLTLSVGTGTITGGTIRVYGYQNS